MLLGNGHKSMTKRDCDDEQVNQGWSNHGMTVPSVHSQVKQQKSELSGCGEACSDTVCTISVWEKTQRPKPPGHRMSNDLRQRHHKPIDDDYIYVNQMT